MIPCHLKAKSQIVYHYLMHLGPFPASHPIMNHLDFSKNSLSYEVTAPLPLLLPLPACPSPSSHSLQINVLIYIYLSGSLKATSAFKPSWPTTATPSGGVDCPPLCLTFIPCIAHCCADEPWAATIYWQPLSTTRR